MPTHTFLPPELARRPFTVDEARAAGLSYKMLRGGGFQRLFRTVYARASLPLTTERWVEGARLIIPKDAIAIGTTGLALRGVTMGDLFPLQFLSTHRHERRHARIDVHRCDALPPHDDGVACPEHCFVSAARPLGFVDTVATGDWLLHRKLSTLGRLGDYLSRSSEHGVVAARRAFRYVRERVESPRETYVRLLLVLAGLPEPACNLLLGDEHEAAGRADMVYLRWRVIVEYDGYWHAEDKLQWERDVVRLGDFDDLGWVVVRVTNSQLKNPRAVVGRVYRKLVAAGYRGPAPVFDARWRSYFEQ